MKNKIKLTEKYLESLGLDTDILQEVEDKTVKRLAVESEIEEDEIGFIRGTISDVSIDSDGDVVLPSAFDFKRFEKNPVVLFNHSLNSPIGFVDGITISPSEVRARVRFGKTEEAQKIYQLTKDKVLRTFSVGFITLDEVRKGQTGWDEEFNLLKNTYPDRFDAKSELLVDRIIKKALLVELSIVTVPANMNAVIDEIKALRKKVEETAITSTDSTIEDIVADSLLIKELELGIDEAVEEVVEEVIDEAVKVEPVSEAKKLVIKKVGKVSEKIKLVSTVKKEKQKELNDLFLKNWGV